MNRARRILTHLALIITTSAAGLADDVDDWVKAQMQSRHIPAISIAVIKDGVMVKGGGIRNR